MNPRRKFQLAAAFGSVGLVATALVTATPASAQPVVVPCSVTDLVTAITNANTAEQRRPDADQRLHLLPHQPGFGTR
ncbi:hypothetical protein GCM10020000_16390 [Streptomyces olivoverticillatus]